jgi:hypothetical protein
MRGVGSCGLRCAQVHRLDPRWTPDVRSPYRHVRSRLYFTSESHIHSLVNTLRYSYLLGAPAGRVSPILREQVAGCVPRLCYCSHQRAGCAGCT